MNCESRKGQDDAEIRLDWNKVYSKEMSFKIFADKWMPYIDLESIAKELGECAKATADLADQNIRDTTISGSEL